MWTNEETAIVESLDRVVREEGVRRLVDEIAARLRAKVDSNPDLRMAKEPVALSNYGAALPNAIASSWVYIMRAPCDTGAERHPNSHQRTLSYIGKGDFPVSSERSAAPSSSAQWQSNFLNSDTGSKLDSRWISIPPNTWHRAVATEGDWIMVSFHSASDKDLIEERPGGNPRSEKLRMAMIAALPRLAAISEEQASRGRGEGKWIRKEILGHLIDSATNNHQRFVRAQLAGRLEFPGYDQDRWVAAQGYRRRTWAELVSLWENLNRNLMHIMAIYPQGRLATECAIGNNPPHTVEFLMFDYTDHMQHHLVQIFAE